MNEVTLSKKPYWRRAARTPKRSADTSEIISPAPIRITVFGKTSQITSETGRYWV